MLWVCHSIYKYKYGIPEAMKQKRLSQEEVQKIQELKEAGKSNREIANEIGVSHTAVNRLATSDKCQKFPDSPEPSNVIPSPVQFQKQEAVDDYDDEKEQGKTQREIAEEIGVAHTTVGRQLVQNDKCHSAPTPTHFESEEAPNVIKAPVGRGGSNSVPSYREEFGSFFESYLTLPGGI